MMFAAGIGIGLLFFGVLEPTYYNFSENGGARPLNIDITQPGNEYIGVVGTILRPLLEEGVEDVGELRREGGHELARIGRGLP